MTELNLQNLWDSFQWKNGRKYLKKALLNSTQPNHWSENTHEIGMQIPMNAQVSIILYILKNMKTYNKPLLTVKIICFNTSSDATITLAT